MNCVGIFWDYENCAPPTGIPGYVVAERLRAACGVHGSITQFRAYLELSAPHSAPTISSPNVNTPSDPDSTSYLPTSPKTLALRSELQSSGVSLIDCPHDSRKNVADAMLACDLVCFALDHPTTFSTPHPSLIPSSPYSIPGTPFSYLSPPHTTPPKTTVVLVSGDRDFAYPLAVLKARRYEVGLIIPPGGAHPALRAQASWVLNWKDVMEDTIANGGLKADLNSISSTKMAQTAGQTSSSATTTRTSSQSAEPRTSPRRSSFPSRRGSVSISRRGSISSSSPIPPPPPPTDSTTLKAPRPSLAPGLHVSTSASPIPRPPLPPIPLDEPAPQLPPTPKMSRRSSLRRAAKAGSRPPSRSRSMVGIRNAKPDSRIEPEVAGTSKTEERKPRPTIIPVPLTASPVGSAGPSFAAMSPQGQGRPHTPPLFSTHAVSPPPPAAPPALAPPPTPPAKVLMPPSKPPTPPRDASRMPHRPSVPHVSTPRPPVPTPQELATSSKPGSEGSYQDAPTAPLTTSALQSLVPAAPALRPTNRPPLTVPSLTAPAANSNALTPATPVTPPASPPFRTWARLQPVNDETDADGDQTVAVKRARKGKEKIRDDLNGTNPESGASQQHIEPKQVKTDQVSNAKEELTKLVVDVAMAIKSCGQPSAISSILRSYSERTPNAEYDGQLDCDDQNELIQVPDSQNQVQEPNSEVEDEDEEKFPETFYASLARSPPVPCASWTPPAATAPRTPGTIKALLLDLVGEISSTGDSQRPPHSTTPRPLQRAHSLPAGVPILQTLLAGLEGARTEFKRNSLDAHIELLESVSRAEAGGRSENSSGRVYSRAGSPLPPPLVHRNTLPSSTMSVNLSALGLSSNPSVDSTYREFRALIDVLERLRRGGNERPLRSLVGSEVSREVFMDAGVSSFREYVTRANTAGVVEVGGGSVQGREWISLSGHWQGMSSGFE